MSTATPFYRADHGIDLAAPGGLEELLALHRSIFGGYTMTEGAGEENAETGNDGDNDGEQQQHEGETPEAQIERLSKELRAARAEAGKSRTKAKENAANEAREAVLAELAKSLGLGEGEPTLDAVTAEATEAKAAAREAAVELAVYKAAGKAGLDAERLLDSRAFVKQVQGLDPEADDFATKITDALKATGEQFKISRAPGASGIPSGGGSGESHAASAKAKPGLDRLRAAYAETAAR